MELHSAYIVVRCNLSGYGRGTTIAVGICSALREIVQRGGRGGLIGSCVVAIGNRVELLS